MKLHVVPHHPENWQNNFKFCAACPDFDARTALCKGGLDHRWHCNLDYCPAGKFGNGQRPGSWPHGEELNIHMCRACEFHQDARCTLDQAGIREHAREDVCPIGRYVDGFVGKLEAPPPPAAAELGIWPAEAPNANQTNATPRRSCCGGQ